MNTSGSVSAFIILLFKRRKRVPLRCREVFFYFLCKASHVFFPFPVLAFLGSNCDNSLRAAPVVVSLKTLNKCSFAESQTPMLSTLEDPCVPMLHASTTTLTVYYIPSLPPPPGIGSGFSYPDIILLRKGQYIYKTSLNSLFHSVKF